MAPIPGAVKNAGTFHVATGEWTRSQQTFGILAQDVLYRNDVGSGYFGLFDQDEFAYDEGRLPGDGEPVIAGGTDFGTADAYIVTGFQFGYCSLTSNATSYELNFLEAYAPCTDPTGIPFAAEFITTGLPNNGCWVVAFDLTGTTGEFTLAAEGGDGSWDNDSGLDDFGYRFRLNAGQGQGTGQQDAGPILSGNLLNLPTIGAGTQFRDPGATEGTGLGSEDFFWLTSPSVADGCYFFGGCPVCANYDTAFFGAPADGDDISAYCDPANANSVSANGSVLSHDGGFGTAAATFTVTDTPNQPGVLFAGPDQLDLPFGCGRRCVGGQVARYSPIFPSNNTVSATVDMTVLGNLNNIQFWYRDPANAGNCGASFNLSNALTNQ
jgi:hypothetical protein